MAGWSAIPWWRGCGGPQVEGISWSRQRGADARERRCPLAAGGVRRLAAEPVRRDASRVPRRPGGLLRVGRPRRMCRADGRRSGPPAAVPRLPRDPWVRTGERRPEGCGSSRVLRLGPPSWARPRGPVEAAGVSVRRRPAAQRPVAERARDPAGGKRADGRWARSGGWPPCCAAGGPRRRVRPARRCGARAAVRSGDPGVRAVRARPGRCGPRRPHGDRDGQGRQGAPSPGARPVRRRALEVARRGPLGRGRSGQPIGCGLLEPPRPAARATRRPPHRRPPLTRAHAPARAASLDGPPSSTGVPISASSRSCSAMRACGRLRSTPT